MHRPAFQGTVSSSLDSSVTTLPGHGDAPVVFGSMAGEKNNSALQPAGQVATN